MSSRMLSIAAVGMRGAGISSGAEPSRAAVVTLDSAAPTSRVSAVADDSNFDAYWFDPLRCRQVPRKAGSEPSTPMACSPSECPSRSRSPAKTIPIQRPRVAATESAPEIA
jgi:hypothetical protein